jgi:hypothetical protein
MTHDYILLARIYHVHVKIERRKIFAAPTELTPNFAAHGRHTASRRSSDHINDVRCSNACASTGHGLAHRRAGQNLARLGPNAYHDALCQVNNADVFAAIKLCQSLVLGACVLQPHARRPGPTSAF